MSNANAEQNIHSHNMASTLCDNCQSLLPILEEGTSSFTHRRQVPWDSSILHQDVFEFDTGRKQGCSLCSLLYALISSDGLELLESLRSEPELQPPSVRPGFKLQRVAHSGVSENGETEWSWTFELFLSGYPGRHWTSTPLCKIQAANPAGQI